MSEFDEQAALKESERVFFGGNAIAFREGARWQFDQLQQQLAAEKQKSAKLVEALNDLKKACDMLAEDYDAEDIDACGLDPIEVRDCIEEALKQYGGEGE